MSHVPDLPVVSNSTRLVVGIDPGLDQHGVVVLHAATCRRIERLMVPNTIAGMQDLAARMAVWRAQSGDVLTVAIEEASSFGEALETYLSQEGCSVVVVSELKVVRFKQALRADANDLIDAEAIARFVLIQPDLSRTPARQAIEAEPHGTQHQQLRQLSRRHARWTQERTAACNELHALLRRAWLADYQRFCSDLHGAAALAVWQHYPTPSESAQADPAAIVELIRQASHGCVKKEAREAKARDIQHTGKIMVLALGKKDPNRWNVWAEDIRVLARQRCTH